MNDDLVERLHNPCNAFLVDEVTMDEAAEEIIRLRAKVDAVYSERNRLAAAFARVTELEGVLLEARDDLTEWIDVAHQHREKYPHIMQDFENDMEIVRRIDAALEGKKE